MRVRPLLCLLILLVSLTTSGIASAFTATSTGDDCCADGAETERAVGASAEEHDDDAPDRDGNDCPPLCHACACSPMFAVPELLPLHPMTRMLDRLEPVVASSQLPVSPPGEGVFHPPRRIA